jgi:hypothetical protein
MRSVSVGLCARILAAVASPTLLLLLLVAPVAASGPFGTINVDPRATLDLHTGVLTVSGTVDCTAAGSIEMQTFATQQVGQATVTGSGFGSVVCAEAGTTLTWQTTVVPDLGKFNPGAIDLFVDGQHCLPAPDGCVPDPIDTQVNAHPLGKVPPPPPPPSNDEATGAIALTLDGGPYTEDTSAATIGATDPVCPEIQPFANHTVWFTITAGTDTAAIELSTAGSNFDTTLAVLDGTGAVVACNDDVESGVIRTSDLIFAPTPGATYTIVAGSWENTSGGTLILNATSTVVPPPPPPPPAAPVNDDPAGALALVLGTPSDALDTSGATIGPEDPADGVCDLPVNATTVWYTLEIAPADVGWVQVDTLASDYDTTLYVFDAAGNLLACNDQAANSNQSLVVFFADPGTYTVLVGSWNGSPGGTLILSATPTVAPLTVEVTIDSIGSVDTNTGNATVTGTITCSQEASGDVGVSLFQEGGRFVADSFADVEVASCGPTPTAWTALVERGSAKFQVGTVLAHADAFATTGTLEAFASTDAEVQLQPAGSKH